MLGGDDVDEPVRRSSGPQTRNVEQVTSPRSLSLPITVASPSGGSESRLSRPPRSEQRSPSSSPTDFGARQLPSTSTSTSEPMRLTRSYNRRDLSEELESSARQLVPSDSPSNWSSRSSAGTATPKHTPTQPSSQLSSQYSSRREIYATSPISTNEPYHTFNETLPVSPSFIPPFQFNNSESSFPPFTNDTNYSTSSSSSIRDDIHSTRSNIPIPSFSSSSMNVRTSSRSRSSSRPSSTAPPPIPLEEDQDSGSQYSLEGTSDSEPWGGLVVGESPPRSPLLSRDQSSNLPSSSTMAVLNDFVQSELGSFSAIDQDNMNSLIADNDEPAGLALLANTDLRRSASASDRSGSRNLSQDRSNRAKGVPRRELKEVVESGKSSAITEDQTWWKEGGLIVNGKSLESTQNLNSRLENEPSVSRLSTGIRSEVDRNYTSSSRGSGSSTPRHTVPENSASALRALHSTSNAISQSIRRSPTTEILDPLLLTSRSSPTSDSSPRRSSLSSYGRSPRLHRGSISESQSGGQSNTVASRSRANSIRSGIDPLSRPTSSNATPTRMDSQSSNILPKGTLLFGNLAQPPFSFQSPIALSTQPLPPPLDPHMPDNSMQRQKSQTIQSRSPSDAEENLSTFVVPLFSPPPQITTPGSGKSDKKALPVLRAKSSRRISAGAVRRAAAVDNQITIAEDDDLEVDRRNSITTPQREDSSQLLSEFSTPLSTSDFADAYFDQSPSRSDTEVLYSEPTIPSNYSLERDMNSRQPFRSSLELNYVSGQYPDSPRQYDKLLDPTQPNKRISQGRRPSTEIPSYAYADARRSSDASYIITDRRPSALSEVISEDGDIFHDATTERDSWGEIQRPTPGLSEPGLMEITLTSQSPVKGDAKARARAFVDDLRRARTEAANSLELSTIGTPDSPSTSLFSAQAETPPPQFDEPSTSSSLAYEIVPAPSPTPPSPTSSISTLPNSFDPISAEPVVTSFPELEKLNRRRRPLPPCLLNTDLRKARTPGQKAIVYAAKINAIANLDSGINVWIGFVKGQYNTKPSLPSAFASRSARLDSSTGSTAPFPLRQDAYTAKEITLGNFGPQDLTPTVPYPGVLLPVNARYSSSSLKAPSVSGTKSNFFSLGRKGSKRTPPSISQPAARSSHIINSPLGPLGIKSPIQSYPQLPLQSQPQRLSGAISGPRALNSRQSFDSINSVATSNYQSSFSYGTMRQGVGALDVQDQLDKLGDILVGVSRDVLHSYLDKAGGDDALAISLYLEDEKRRRV